MLIRSLIVGVGLLLCPAMGWAQPTKVGEVSVDCAGDMTCVQTSTIAVNAGDLIVAATAVRVSSEAHVITAGDDVNGASSYTCPTGAQIRDAATSTMVAFCYLLSSASGTITGNVDLTNGTINTQYIWHSVWRGGTWTLDQLNEATWASGGPYSHGSITTTGSAGVILTSAAQGANISNETPNASFTESTVDLGLREYWQYWITSSTQTTDGAYTSATAHAGSGVIISFTSTTSAGCTGGLLLMGAGKC